MNLDLKYNLIMFFKKIYVFEFNFNFEFRLNLNLILFTLNFIISLYRLINL